MTEQRRHEEALGALFRLRDAIQIAVNQQTHVDLRDLVPSLHDWRWMLCVLDVVEELAALERNR